ncbi:MAG: acetyltransferase [archaeon]
MSKEKVLIIGAGPHAGVIVDILKQLHDKEIIGLTDIDKNLIGTKKYGLNILGDDSIIKKLVNEKKVDSVIIGIGYELLSVRERIFNNLKKNNIKFTKAIHPSAIISKSAKIEPGVAVMAGAVINPETVIKENSVVNTGAIVEHDNKINKGVFIQGGAKLAGGVNVGINSIVGMGAIVRENIVIGSNSIIGAGAVVTKDVPDNVVMAGIPAKKMRENK